MANTMSDAEKQERQKTVVAFIAGLLVGGLLVWIFSSATASPDAAQVEDGMDDNTSAMDIEGDVMGDTTSSGADSMDTSTSNTRSTATQPAQMSPSGEGTLVVRNQPASLEMVISNLAYPTTEGWIVVKDYVNGVGTGILGAARYNTEVGLVPQGVELLRPTIAGSEYQVVFYTENGDRVFDTATDVEMEGTVSTTFIAQ